MSTTELREVTTHNTSAMDLSELIRVIKESAQTFKENTSKDPKQVVLNPIDVSMLGPTRVASIQTATNLEVLKDQLCPRNGYVIK